MLYFFILGNHPALSLAEIFAFFGEKVKLRSFSGNFAVFEFAAEPNLPEDFESLGGSIKFGKIIKESVKNIEEDILFELCRQTKENKVFFGISVYGKIKLRVKNLGMAVKKRIGENGRSARFVVSKEDTLSSVVVKTNKLLSGRGAEFVALGDGKTNFLGKTLAVQEFEEYEKRDYGRPSRDMLRGMLPPKLAKIMINLSGAPKDGVILDPFCGTGTILSEAIILGYKNIIGADNDAEAIKSAEENLNWLKNNFELPTNNCQVFICDAREISKKVGEKSIDAIIAEPYLGPPMRGNELPEKINPPTFSRGIESRGNDSASVYFPSSSRQEREVFGKGGGVNQLINLLKNLYLESFEEFRKVLKPGGKVVFILPIYKIPLAPQEAGLIPPLRKGGNPPCPAGGGAYSPFVKGGGRGDLGKGGGARGMDLKKEIEKIGFEIINPLPSEIKTQFNSQLGPNGGLVYGRENQMIWREILVLGFKI